MRRSLDIIAVFMIAVVCFSVALTQGCATWPTEENIPAMIQAQQMVVQTLQVVYEIYNTEQARKEAASEAEWQRELARRQDMLTQAIALLHELQAFQASKDPSK